MCDNQFCNVYIVVLSSSFKIKDNHITHSFVEIMIHFEFFTNRPMVSFNTDFPIRMLFCKFIKNTSQFIRFNNMRIIIQNLIKRSSFSKQFQAFKSIPE